MLLQKEEPKKALPNAPTPKIEDTIPIKQQPRIGGPTPKEYTLLIHRNFYKRMQEFYKNERENYPSAPNELKIKEVIAYKNGLTLTFQGLAEELNFFFEGNADHRVTKVTACVRSPALCGGIGVSCSGVLASFISALSVGKNFFKALVQPPILTPLIMMSSLGTLMCCIKNLPGLQGNQFIIPIEEERMSPGAVEHYKKIRAIYTDQKDNELPENRYEEFARNENICLNQLYGCFGFHLYNKIRPADEEMKEGDRPIQISFPKSLSEMTNETMNQLRSISTANHQSDQNQSPTGFSWLTT